MTTNAKPDHYLYIIIPGECQDDKARWVRFAAAWKAVKGWSIKVEPAFKLFPPFNDLSLGMAMMPADDDNDRGSTNSNNRNQKPGQGGRR